MPKRIVKFGMVWYQGAESGQQEWGIRGEEVELSADDEKRLDKAGALEPKTTTPAEAAKTQAIPALTDSSSDEDIVGYLGTANAPQIIKDTADWSPELAERVLSFENERQDPRVTVVAKLEKQLES